MQKLNNHFKGQDRNILLIMDNASCHSLSGVQQKQLSGFTALPRTNVTIVFLPPNCISVVQPLDRGIIAAFKLRYKSKLLEWVSSQFDLDQQHDLKKVVPNVKKTILWSYKVWTNMDPQIIQNYWRNQEIFHLIGVQTLLMKTKENNRD